MSSEFPRIMGTCKYCGQSKLLQTEGELSQAQADDMATKECDCKDAKVARNRQSKIDKANKWAEGYFENTPEVILLFKESFRSVANNEAEKISIKVGEWSHSIYLDSDGYLNCKSNKKISEEESFI